MWICGKLEYVMRIYEKVFLYSDSTLFYLFNFIYEFFCISSIYCSSKAFYSGYNDNQRIFEV